MKQKLLLFLLHLPARHVKIKKLLITNLLQYKDIAALTAV